MAVPFFKIMSWPPIASGSYRVHSRQIATTQAAPPTKHKRRTQQA
jgi:hypothetical protein